jgi:nucleobase transporter 1/2
LIPISHGSLQVASRRVLLAGSLFMLLIGVFGKFGALFVTIPEPIIGGVFVVLFGEHTLLRTPDLVEQT